MFTLQNGVLKHGAGDEWCVFWGALCTRVSVSEVQTCWAGQRLRRKEILTLTLGEV